MMSSTQKAVCFTGRRPKDLVGYRREGYIELVDYLKNYIRDNLYPHHTTYISGGAQGFDQLAFWAVEKLRREEGAFLPT